MPSLSYFLSIDMLLKDDNVSQLEMGSNPTTPSCSDTTKQENFFDAKKTIKKVKMTKPSYPYKVNARLYNVDIFNSFKPEL